MVKFCVEVTTKIKEFLLCSIYKLYYLFYFKKNIPSIPKKKKIALFFYGYDGVKKTAYFPLGEFIIREPFLRYLKDKENIIDIIAEKKDFMTLPPFPKYIRKIMPFEEFKKSKESYDYTFFLLNYLNFPVDEIKKKTTFFVSYSHPGLFTHPTFSRNLSYFPYYRLRETHELERTFEMLRLNISLNNRKLWPKINIKSQKRELISFVLLDHKNFKSLSLFNLESILNTLSQSFKKKILLLGDERAINTSEKLMRKLGKNKNIINKVGKTNAFSLAKIIASSKLVISPDTGTAHLAAALKTPLIVYYTTTVLDRWKPLGEKVYQYKVSDPQFQEKIIQKAREILK